MAGAVASIFFNPARNAALPAYVPEGQVVPANALLMASSQAAQLLTPALGGVLFVAIGPVGLLAVDSLSLRLVRAPPLAPHPWARAPGPGPTVAGRPGGGGWPALPSCSSRMPRPSFAKFGTVMNLTAPVSLAATGALAAVAGPVLLITISGLGLMVVGGAGFVAALERMQELAAAAAT